MIYEWAATLKNSLEPLDESKPISYHIVPRHSLIGKVLRVGRVECRSAKEAKGIVHKALKMGMPIDYTRHIDGSFWVFVSHKGTDAIRASRGIQERKVRKPKRIPTLRKSIEILSDSTGLERDCIEDILKTLGANNAKDANEVVKDFANRKWGI